MFEVQQAIVPPSESLLSDGPSVDPPPLLPPQHRHDFILHPVAGVLNYVRRGKAEVRAEDVPQQSISLTLGQVAFTLSQVM